jgi:hypothetical protein
MIEDNNPHHQQQQQATIVWINNGGGDGEQADMLDAEDVEIFVNLANHID